MNAPAVAVGARVERVQAALWPQPGGVPGSVWAVLDLARSPRIPALLLASRLEHLRGSGSGLAPCLPWNRHRHT
ncbi:MAG: hypothetical protein O9343_19070 [Burkholderiaceae bacterium]|jgi:hypothetical protein|nr:hypothetical protein [Burkholderiaceae bacterium]